MIARPLIALIALAALLTSAHAAPTPADSPFLAAGDNEHAWLATKGDLSPVALTHIFRSDEGNLIARRAIPLSEAPAHLAAHDNHLLLHFPPQPAPEPANTDEATPAPAPQAPPPHRFRLTNADEPRPGLFAYANLRALPPLHTDADITAVALVAPATAVVAAKTRTESDPEPTLLLLNNNEWHELAVPPHINLPREPRTIALDNAAIIIPATTDTTARQSPPPAIRIDIVDHPRQAATPDATEPGKPAANADNDGDPRTAGAIAVTHPTQAFSIAWFAEPSPAAVTTPILHTAAGLTTFRIDGPSIAIRVLRDSDPVERGSVTPTQTPPPNAAVTTLDDAILFLWQTETDATSETPSPEPQTAPQNRALANALLVSTDPMILHDAPLSAAPPVPPHQFHLTLLLLASATLTTLLYVLRSDAALRQSVTLPPNTAIASPSRRVLAVCIDLFLAIAITSSLWGEPLQWLVQPVGEVLETHGVATILATLAIATTLSAATESTVGATPGKLLTRCRTVTRRGKRPPFHTALARNACKLTCPPLAIFVLTEPAKPYPGSFGTFVITDTTPPPPSDEPPPPDRHQPPRSDTNNDNQT